MKINIIATGIELTPAISDYVDKKVAALEKYLPPQASEDAASTDILAQVEIGKSTNHHKSGEIFKAEIHITGGGLDYYAVEETEDLYASIDKVKDEIAQEIRRVKGKQNALARRGAQMAKNMMKRLSWGAGKFKFRRNRDVSDE